MGSSTSIPNNLEDGDDDNEPKKLVASAGAGTNSTYWTERDSWTNCLPFLYYGDTVCDGNTTAAATTAGRGGSCSCYDAGCCCCDCIGGGDGCYCYCSEGAGECAGCCGDCLEGFCHCCFGCCIGCCEIAAF